MGRVAWGTRGVALAIAAAVMTAGALPSSFAAGPSGPLISLKIAKKPGGPYKGSLPVNIDDNEAKSLYWRAKNLSNERFTDTYITDTLTTYPAGWKSSWFKGKKEITTDVRGEGYQFNLRRGKSKTFRQRLKAPAPAGVLCDAATAGGLSAGFDTSIALVNTDVCLL